MTRQVSFLQARALFVALQDNSTDNQSEITVVDRTIVPANTTTVKANVTVIPLNNNAAAR